MNFMQFAKCQNQHFIFQDFLSLIPWVLACVSFKNPSEWRDIYRHLTKSLITEDQTPDFIAAIISYTGNLPLSTTANYQPTSRAEGKKCTALDQI